MQPGWWLDLEGPFPLDHPVTLGELRDRSEEIREVLDRLRGTYPGSLYFPFFFWGGTELRPMQPYLNKLPATFVDLFPLAVGDGESGDIDADTPTPMPLSLGAEYREAQVGDAPPTRHRPGRLSAGDGVLHLVRVRGHPTAESHSP